MQYRIFKGDNNDFYLQQLKPAFKILGITILKEIWQNVVVKDNGFPRYIWFYSRNRMLKWIQKELTRKGGLFKTGDQIIDVKPDELIGKKEK